MLRSAVLVHVYHPDLWPEIAVCLHRLAPFPWKLYVNAVAGRVPPGWAGTVAAEFPGAATFESANRGMDVGGTLNLLRHVDLDDLDLVLKLHTKRCDYNPPQGTAWRRDLLRGCLDDPAAVMSLFDRDATVSMVGSRRWLLRNDAAHHARCSALAREQGLAPPDQPTEFFGGTMFWCRAAVMRRVKAMGIGQDRFPSGYAQVGTLAHVVERLFGLVAAQEGRLVGR